MNAITFPTHVGRLTVEVRAAGPVNTWRGPEVFFSVDGIPTLSVAIRDGEPVIDVLGHDPTRFDALPEDLQLAAAWWHQLLPVLSEAWERFAHEQLAELADAA